MSGDPAAKEFRPRLWPVWSFVAISLLLNVSVLPLIEWIEFRNFEQEIQAIIFFAGVLAGECCFVALVAGLTKRTWLGAYLFGLGLAVAGYVTVLCGAWSIDEFDRDAIAGLALLPAFLLVAACPLYGIRHFFGWRLTAEGESPPSRQPLLLADIFSLIAILATVLVLVRVPQVISEADANEYWWQVVITCLVLVGTSFVVLPLHARVALGKLSRRLKFLWLAILALFIVVSCFGIIQCFTSLNTSWSERLEILPFLFAFLGPAIGMFYLSLLLLSASGMRLVRGHGSRKAIESETSQPHTFHLRRRTWWRIGGAIAVTMATSIYLANLQQWRAVRDKENATLTRRAQATGGALGINDRIPSNLRLGPITADADFELFTICNQLEYLCLVDTKITDGGLANLRHFPRLRLLRLENMSVTDDGLVHLKHLSNLETLEIVNCDVKGSHLAGLPNKQLLATLDLTRTQFGDEEAETLAKFPKLQKLTLNQTGITDHTLSTLDKLPKLYSLKLVNTNIKGEQFPSLPELQHLNLSKTKVDAATVESLANLQDLRYLSLSETKVTNAALSTLTRLPRLYSLDLNGNSIDDEGIRQLHRAPELIDIELADTRVTGSGFAIWRSKAQLRYLILDRTLIDDEGVAALSSIGEVDDLSLAKTKITDACLPHLAQIKINELDIRGTQITFNGLVTNGLPSVGTLRVASDQFTSQQISQLEQQLKIKVEIGKP